MCSKHAKGKLNVGARWITVIHLAPVSGQDGPYLKKELIRKLFSPKRVVG